MRVRNSSNGHDEGSAAKKRRVVGLPQIEETVREFLETICQKCGPKPGANSTRDSGSSNSSSSFASMVFGGGDESTKQQ